MPNLLSRASAVLLATLACTFSMTPLAAHAAVASCDQSLALALHPDANTKVVLIRSFHQGEPVRLPKSPAQALPAPVDVCLIKLLVGPGKGGKPDAPSTSQGIGIEVWLPTPGRWNGIIRASGSGGWAGGFHSTPDAIGFFGAADPMTLGAIGKGYVVSTSDHGHFSPHWALDGSFTLDEDGRINTVLWHDFAERSLHELAVQTKAVVQAFYGKPQRYAYWDGFSTGGRQGMKLAQKYPGDFDGILAGAPAINWSRFITNELYPQVIMRSLVGHAIDPGKLSRASAAATRACGGTGLGFLLDPTACRYDPTKDRQILCAPGAATDTQHDAMCLTDAEAAAIVRIWYGQTRDGSAPDPGLDNGGTTSLDAARHLWWGLTRGSNLLALAGTPAFPIAATQVAVELGRPGIAVSGTFINATGNGQDEWKTVSLEQLAKAYDQGLAVQQSLGGINTDSTDLTAFGAAGHKLLMYHGFADELIPPMGSIAYYEHATQAAGGQGRIRAFARLYMIPGLSHDGTLTKPGSIDPATGAPADARKVPLPQNVTGRDELFETLRAWVEKGVAPGSIAVASSDASVSLPLCAWPARATYKGTGDRHMASSYVCS